MPPPLVALARRAVPPPLAAARRCCREEYGEGREWEEMGYEGGSESFRVEWSCGAAKTQPHPRSSFLRSSSVNSTPKNRGSELYGTALAPAHGGGKSYIGATFNTFGTYNADLCEPFVLVFTGCINVESNSVINICLLMA
uniref:Uncharacterized protein n=1 Tax=Oryza sativa subsp. japonica TaxID=39947 RepID=Q8H4H1_ORYSJ|nr:hypothetical protein [Oryza sativa Japonica Group]